MNSDYVANFVNGLKSFKHAVTPLISGLIRPCHVRVMAAGKRRRPTRRRGAVGSGDTYARREVAVTLACGCVRLDVMAYSITAASCIGWS